MVKAEMINEREMVIMGISYQIKLVIKGHSHEANYNQVI
jgi:hypothetical protein